ncbi:MAG: hypothetical protein K2M31_02630 [Muribaculaceae bacterium]|nr:hypothetical protein [Muribaculaceae bacterium]
MKKFLFCAAAVAMLGLASCSSKSESAADTAALDTNPTPDTVIAVQEEVVEVDSANQPVAEAAAAEVTEAVAADSNK